MDGRVLRPLPAALLAVTTVLAVVSIPLLWGHELRINTVLYPIAAVVLTLTGALIASRGTGSRSGWLLCGMGTLNSLGEVISGYGYHTVWPAAVRAEWVGTWVQMIEIGSYAILLALFCSERAATPRSRIWVWSAVLATVLMTVGAAFGHSTDGSYLVGRNPYAVGHRWFGVAYVNGQVLMVASLLASTTALILGFRRSTGVERQQLKWVVYAVSSLAIVGPLALFFYYDSVAVQIAVAIPVTAVPVAMCVAILRYRLYDIDVIINRTVVYGALSLALAGCYIGLSLTLGALLGTTHSPWVTAGATLAAAVAFRPLRAWIQDAVDRRFRRARYDALARVDAFLEDLRSGRAAPQLLDGVLREALSLPDLGVAYFLDDGGTYVDTDGREMTLDTSRVHTRVERGGVLLAVVLHTDVVDSLGGCGDRTLMREALSRAGLAIEIARLQAEVQHQLAEVTASRARIIAAGYEERRRLERDLHDGAQQRLVSIGLALRHAQHQLGSSPVSETIDEAVVQISGAIADLRDLANGVRPALLDNGLGVALRDLANRSPLPVDIKVNVERYAADIEATAYFVACEAVTNAVKHSRASEMALQAHRSDSRLVLTVADNGIGGAYAAAGSGLRGLGDRVAAHGGRITVRSPIGEGTTIIAELPCMS